MKKLFYPLLDKLNMGKKRENNASPEINIRGEIINNGMDTRTIGTLKSNDYVLFVPRLLKDPTKLISQIADKTTEKNKKANAISQLSNIAGSGFNKDEFVRGLTTVLTKGGTTNKFSNSLYIGLPLKPEFLKISLDHSWELQDELFGQAVRKGVGAIGSLVAGNITGEGGAIQQGKDALLAYGARKGFKLLKTPLSQAGIFAYLPEKQVFSGTAPISLGFNWTLSPRNTKEAQVIRQICLSFAILSHAQPPVNDKFKELGIALYRNPAIWRIDFPNEGKFKDMIVKDNSFPAMVCTNVSFDFGDGDFWSHYGDGFPTQINLSATFVEYFSTGGAPDRYGVEIQDLLSESS